MRTIVLMCAFAAGLSAATLLDAAKAGDKAAIRALLAQKADAKATLPDGATALHWTAYHDDAESTDLLLKAGADANAANDLGATPLWLAAQNGSSAVVRRLLTAGANPNLALLSGETPLMVAARGGFAEIAAQLLAKGANPNTRGTRGQTALMWAVSNHHPEVVKALIAGKADIHAKSDVWSEVMSIPPHGYLPYNKNIPHGGETGLMFAARVGDLESAKLLLAAGANAAAGANVNDADAWGVTAVTLAAHSGFTDLVLYLLDKGADPNKSDNGFAALHEGIMRRDEKMIAALLDHGADPNLTLKTWTPTRRSSEDWNFDYALVGATPLYMAARFAQPNIMRMLIAKGADTKFIHAVEYVAEDGFGRVDRQERNTLIMAAAGMGRAGNLWVPIPQRERERAVLETVKLAVELGGDINAVGLDGRTALDGANQLRMPSVVAYLTEKGAKATAPAGGGRGGRGGAPPAAPAK
jgi:ankyrin repeat protein